MAVVVLGGCAKNAILELELQLPAEPETSDGELFALTQVRRADEFPFAAEWRADQDPAGVPLGPEPVTDQLSVETEDETVDLHVRIRFCGDPRCTSLDDALAPELWLRIEQPFYIGQRTFWEFDVPAVPEGQPAEPVEVDKCEIRGCVEGDTSSSYCRLDGTHVCEG
jgi:hypothetical protein